LVEVEAHRIDSQMARMSESEKRYTRPFFA
jgi:hypothetical protein